MHSIVNEHRTVKGEVLVTLRPRESTFDPDKVDVSLPAELYRFPVGTVLRDVRMMLRNLIDQSPTYRAVDQAERTEAMAGIRLDLAQPPSLLQLLSNRRAVAQSASHEDLSLDDCDCKTGPFASFIDVNTGHVLTTDMSILQPAHTALADNHVGLNMRVLARCRSNHLVVQDIVLALHSMLDASINKLQLPHDIVVQELEQHLSRLWKWARHRIRTWERNPNPSVVTLDQGADEHIQLMREHLLMTCLDKASSASVAVCKRFSRHLITTRLQSNYVPISMDELQGLHEQMSEALAALTVSPVINYLSPYMYPIVKIHKCLEHTPLVLHQCKLEYRFIQSGCDAFTTWLADMDAAILKTTFAKINAARDARAALFRQQHGYRLRFRYGIDAWQTVALNLPHKVPAHYTIHVGDIQDAFPSLPLQAESCCMCFFKNQLFCFALFCAGMMPSVGAFWGTPAPGSSKRTL